MTSRAEYRLLLRHDNADQRLLEKGFQLGVVSQERYEQFQNKMETIQKTKELLQEVHIKPTESINAYLSSLGFDPLQHGCSALELLKRPQVTIKGLQSWIEQNIDASVARQIEIEVKYAGYIEKAKRDARHLQAMDQKKLPEGLDYLHMDNLRLEARQKLDQIRPSTLGQASRISGINPSDIAILSLCVKPHKK